MSIAKVLQQVRLPGEKLADLSAQAKSLSDADKATLIRWYEEEQKRESNSK